MQNFQNEFVISLLLLDFSSRILYNFLLVPQLQDFNRFVSNFFTSNTIIARLWQISKRRYFYKTDKF